MKVVGGPYNGKEFLSTRFRVYIPIFPNSNTPRQYLGYINQLVYEKRKIVNSTTGEEKYYYQFVEGYYEAIP